MKTLLASLAVVAVLVANAVHAGSLAPAPRVVAEFDRNFIERSGAQTLEELLDTGIARYFLTGGQPLLVLVNGRPYATTDGDLDTLPLSAIERLELLSGDSLGTLGGSAVRGALNVVLRTDLDGVEARAVARMPSKEGGDGWQGSAFWGGTVGEGRMTIGVDALRRREINARSREYSRSVWSPGGAFSETRNVSVGGNTVWILQLEDGRTLTDIRSVSLGDCDPAKGYTGPLTNPPGIRSGDKGCGFAYGAIMWNTERFEQKSAVLNLDHPVGEAADLHVDANFTRGDSAFRYAPSVGSFAFTPNDALLQAINEAAGSAFEADDDDLFVVAHRFVGHGNRDWRWDADEYDISASLEGRLAEGLGYEARISAYGLDGFMDGDTFVHTGRIRDAILDGRYNLEDPFSRDPEHLEAIKDSSLRLENDFGGDSLEARLALEGSGFAIGGRDAAWTAGFELESVDAHDLTDYRSDDGETFDVSEVLGSGGVSYEGERTAAAAFAEMSLPLAENLDLRLAGRGDEYDDVGGMESWRLGAEYRASDLVTLHSSWSTGDRAPSMLALHAFDYQDHPYIECDPGLRESAPLVHGAQPAAGDACDRGQPGARSFGHRKGRGRRGGPQGAVLPERRAVPALACRPAGAEQRRLGHAEPGRVHGRQHDELHRAHRRRHHHSRPLSERRRHRSHGRQHPARRGLQNRLGSGRHARGLAARHQLGAAHRGGNGPVRHPRKCRPHRSPGAARRPERRLDRQLPLRLREPDGHRILRVLDRPRRGAGLARSAGAGRCAGHGRRVQPDRRRPHGEHRQPRQRGRPHGSRLGTHLLPHPQHAVLSLRRMASPDRGQGQFTLRFQAGLGRVGPCPASVNSAFVIRRRWIHGSGTEGESRACAGGGDGTVVQGGDEPGRRPHAGRDG